MNQTASYTKPAIFIGLLAVFGLGAGWILASQPDVRQPVLARAGEVEVTAEAFRSRYVAYLLKTGVPDQPSLRRSFLDDFVATRLLIREARAGGAPEDADYQFRQDQVRRKLLVEAYAHRVLFDTLTVREDEVQAMFVRANTQLTARHLYARTREEADVLYARLQAGEAFETLARDVFADPTLAETGGSLGTFGFDEMDPAFEDAAYALAVGEISEPVQTAQGYSIIQLEDRFTKPLLTELEYAKKRANLRAYVLSRKQQEARRHHARRLADELAVAFEETTLGALLGQITGAGMVEDEEAFQRLLGEPLVAFGPPGERRTWTVATFREHARFTSDDQRAQVQTRDDLVDFVQGLAVRAVMMERARQQGLAETPAFARALDEAMDDYVLERERARVDAGVDVPEDSARAYYEAAPPGEFLYPAEVRLHEILLATQAEAEHVKAQLATASFETLARTHTLRPGARAAAGDLGFVRSDQLGPLAGEVFEAAEGAVLGPFASLEHHILLKVGERREARPMTYEEAQEQIVAMLRLRYTGAHRRAVYDDLRARYPVDVDTELLYSLPLVHETDK